MNKWLLKYGAVIFILNIFLASIEFTFEFSSIMFKIIMIVYSIVIIINLFQLKNVFLHKAFKIFLFINLINILYFLLFHSINDISAIQFLFARGVQFTIITTSVYYNFEYYRDNFINHLTLFIISIVFAGFIFNPDVISDRYNGLIWNANTLSVFVIMAFSFILLKDKQKNKVDYVFLTICLLTAIATGSRGVIIGIVIAYLIKYSFSNRIFLYSLVAITLYFVLINFNLFTTANRFSEQSVFNDRILQYRYAFETFLQKPTFGYGLDKYAYMDMNLVPDYVIDSSDGSIIAPHNGYIALVVQYGLIFGSFVIYLLFGKLIELVSYFKNSIDINRTYLFILIYAILGAVYETLITGINDFHTFLFWFSIAFLSYSKYNSILEDEN